MTLGVCALFCATAASSAVSSAPASHIEELTVTGARIPVEERRAPVLLDSIDATDIAYRQSPWIGDLLRALPGIAVSESGPPGSLAEVRVRGAEANQTLVLLDGIELNDPATGSLVDFAQIDPGALRRLEMVRGPQSALWGADALAGVIYIDTTPTPGTRARSISADTGSLDTRNVALRLAEAPRFADEGAWYYAGSLSLLESAGANVSTSGGEDDGYRRHHWLFNAGHRGATSRVSVVAGGADGTSEFDPTPFPDFVPRDGDSELESSRRLAGLSAETSTGAWRHAVKLWQHRTDNDSFEDGVRTTGSQARKTHASWQVSRTVDVGSLAHRGTLALEREWERFRGEGPVGAFGDPNQRQSIATTSGVLEYGLAVEPLDLVLSARHDSNEEFEDAASVRAALRWNVTADADLFLSAGTGVKNPTFTERFGFTPDTFIGNPDLEPESSEGFSAGWSQRLGAVSFRAVWFIDRLEDEIDGFVFDAARGGFTAANRDGASAREGLEVSATWTGELTAVSCTYTYLDATEPVEGRDVDEIRRPRHSGGCIVDLEPVRAVHLQAGVSYTGRRSDSDFATFPATPVTLGAYPLAHFAALWDVSDRVSLRAGIDNALDERYQDVFGYDTAGRRVHVGIEARFD